MERKQARHVEWGRLQITGQPILAAAAVGAAHLVWLACRASMCLVHVFRDAHLVSTWRFASDPMFLLFGPTSNDGSFENARNTSADHSLLVITSDGRFWQLDLTSNGSPSNGRPSKKRKESVPRAIHQLSNADADFKRSLPELSRDKNISWDDRGICTYKAEELAFSCAIYDASAVANYCTGGKARDGADDALGSMRLKLQWRKPLIHSQTKHPKKLQVRPVSPRALLGLLQTPRIATLGPNGLIALAALDGELSIIQLSCSKPSKCMSVTAVQDVGPPTGSREPTCMLFVTVRFDCHAPSEGNAATLQKHVFASIFGHVGTATPDFGVLQGDRNGSVYAISLRRTERGLNSYTRLLCDLSQPIVAILSVSLGDNAASKPEQPGSGGHPEEKELHGDSFVIVGQLGRIVLIKGVNEESKELECGPFLSGMRLFPWRSIDHSPVTAQLSIKGLTIHEWDLRYPIASACLLGPYRLCSHSGTHLLYVDLFESIGYGDSNLRSAKNENSTTSWTQTGLSSAKAELTNNRSSGYSGLPKRKWTLRKELVSYIVPLADEVVATASKGILGSSGGSRPLFALTARGRLVGVEVTDHVSSRALSFESNIQNSWQLLQSKMERRIQTLLQMMAEIAEYADVIKKQHLSVTLAVKELAAAFRLVYDICSDQTRDRVYSPDISLVEEGSSGKLWCSLTSTIQPSVLLPVENLSFVPSGQQAPSNHSFNSCLVKVSVKLHNQSPITVSPYWSLLLEICTLPVNTTKVVSSSSVINGGFGLPTGGYFSHDFWLEIPCTGFCPLLVSVFLCHLHDPHQSLVNFKSSGSIFSDSFSLKSKHAVGKFFGDLRDRPLSKSTVLDKEELRMSWGYKVAPSQTSGVCLLLLHCRLDVIFLLTSTSLQCSTNPLNEPRIGAISECLLSSSTEDPLLGLLSGCVTFSCRDISSLGISSPVRKILQEVRIGDFIHTSKLSKTAKMLCSSSTDGATQTLSLKVSSGRSSSTSIVFQASSLLLGARTRETLLWCLSEHDCKFVVQESLFGKLLDSDKIQVCPKEKMHNDVNKLLQQLQTVTSHWNNISIGTASEVSPSLPVGTRVVIQGVVKAYRASRE